MCLETISVITGVRNQHYRYNSRQRNVSNLRSFQQATPTLASFSVGLWNCQSAVNKADFISAYATNQCLDLLALTETWLKPENTATPAALSSNHTFSHTSRPSKRGGGTGILISNNWKFNPLPTEHNYVSFEYHTILVTAPIKISVVVIYRPPGQLGDFVDELDTLLSSLPELDCPLLVLGDMNIHLDKPCSGDFLSLIKALDLELVCSPPTHKGGKQLDLILTRDCKADCLLVTPLHTSDHFFIRFSVCLPEQPPVPTPMVSVRRNLRNLPPEQFASAVASVLPPLSTFSSLEVDAATESLSSTLSLCLDSLCPLSTKPVRSAQPRPWLTDTIRKLRSTLRAAERKWHKTSNPENLKGLQTLLVSFSTTITTAKTAYYNDKISSTTDSRKLFSAFKTLLNPPPPPPATNLSADNFASFFTEKVAKISKTFCDPPSHLLSSVKDPAPTTKNMASANASCSSPTTWPSLSPPVNGATLASFTPLTESEVSKLLIGSRPTTCPLDPIPTKLLQAIAPTVVPSITCVINASLASGIFPSAFKQARVMPLLKKPSLNPAQVENYRPVSLLPFLSKTIERAVSKQVTDFLTQNELLDINQSGFKSGHSTETALLSVTEALRTARAAGQSSVLILLDLSAAFDTVNHSILLSILSNMGITGMSLSWFQSYLSERSFTVSWQGHTSSSQSLGTGVPQGSVLGPLLFAMYTTSLGQIIRSHGFSYHCYADDTQLYLSFQPDDPTVSARISACLSNLSVWMKEHHLQLNLSKTELLVIPAQHSIKHNINLNFASTTVAPTKVVKSLGVMIDEQLSFADHIASVARSCRFALYNIRKIRPYLTQYATQLLVQAMVISRLDYCNALLAGLPACSIKPLQKVQNAAARLVFKQPKRAHVTPLLTDLHWLPVAARIKHKSLSLAYRVTSGSAPTYLNTIIRAYTPARALRSSQQHRLALPSLHTRRSQSRSFVSTVPQWWNKLPVATRAGASLSVFKKLLKTFLFREHLLTN